MGVRGSLGRIRRTYADNNNVSHIIEMSIMGDPVGASKYDYRMLHMIKKLARRRVVDTDYFDFLRYAQSGSRTAALRDFETKADAARKEKG